MSFSRKILLSIFSATFIASALIIWFSYRIIYEKIQEKYSERYSTFAKVLGNTLVQLERNTELLMHNAALVVAKEDSQSGLLTTKRLRDLRDQLNVTHIFITDSAGKFIRSTNEDPKLIPNLFSFCEKYKNLILGSEHMRTTPIIPPQPEPSPFKFLTIPNATRSRLIEIGMRVDFIATTFSSAMRDDSNVLRINLYTPDGISLGSFDQNGPQLERKKIELKNNFNQIETDGITSRIFLQVNSVQPSCCQCDTAGISKRGQYYYILEAVISNAELKASLASIGKILFILLAIAFLFSWLIAKVLSERLVSKIKHVISRVREMGHVSAERMRIGLKGKDEIAFLAGEFDALLERLENSKSELISAQSAAAAQQAKNELAAQVVHDIRSPLAALNMLATGVTNLPEEPRVLLREAANRIRDITNLLYDQQKSLHINDNFSKKQYETEIELLSSLVEGVISEKRIQFKNLKNITIDLYLSVSSYGLFSEIVPREFERMISNLVNNAVESIEGVGRIIIELRESARFNEVIISDTGRGIPAEILPTLTNRGHTFGKVGGKGLGLYHARMNLQKWGGNIAIDSQIQKGTTVRIKIPKVSAPQWFAPDLSISPNSTVAILDDDLSIHQVWENRLKNLKGQGYPPSILHFYSPTELIAWADKTSNKSLAQIKFLIDFEFKSDELDGLKVIEKMNIHTQAFLVTSHFSEQNLKVLCVQSNVKLVPKSLAHIIPINMHFNRESLKYLNNDVEIEV